MTATEQPAPAAAVEAHGSKGVGLGARLAAQACFGLAIVGLWELAATSFVNPFWIGQPSAIAVRLWQVFVHEDMLLHTGTTLLHAVVGLAASLVVGVPVGMLFGANRFVASTIEPYFLGFYSLPRVALAPLFILWFGIGALSKVMMAFSMVVFVVVLNTHEGVRGVDRDFLDMLRAMKASRFYTFRKVILPSIVPWVFTSMRVGIGLALVGAVIGELVGANRGLGWYVEYSAGRIDIIGVFTGLVVLAVLGMGLNEVVKAVERRVMRGRY